MSERESDGLGRATRVELLIVVLIILVLWLGDGLQQDAYIRDLQRRIATLEQEKR